jgi:hypothetical protein
VKGIRLVGAIVVLLLALGSSIALAEHTEGETQGSGSPPPGAESLPERTAYSETFGFHDGSLETRIYPAPVNYRDAEGNWRPINEDLQEGEASAFENGQNDFDLALPEQLDGGAVRVSSDEDGSRANCSAPTPTRLKSRTTPPATGQTRAISNSNFRALPPASRRTSSSPTPLSRANSATC